MSSEERFTDEPPRPASDPNYPPPPGPLTNEDRQWAMIAHLSALVGGFIGPLIVWMLKKDESRFVDDQGKEALNFQLNMAIAAAILTAIAFATCGFGAVLFAPWGIYVLVMTIIAGMQANKGERYRYPATWRIIPWSKLFPSRPREPAVACPPPAAPGAPVPAAAGSAFFRPSDFPSVRRSARRLLAFSHLNEAARTGEVAGFCMGGNRCSVSTWARQAVTATG